MFRLTHPVVVLFLQSAQFAFEVDLDGEVEVAVVALVRLHGETAVDLLVPLDSQIVVQVEHHLLPVSVRCFRRGAEPYPLVTPGELDSEESHLPNVS